MAALQTKHVTYLGEQQPQVIGRLRSGSDGRATRSGNVSVGYRDGRRNAVDPLGLRLLEPLEELPGVGREALDVPPLPLGIEGIQRQAAFAAAAEPAQHNQPVLRQVQVDSFEVVDRDSTQRNVARNAHAAYHFAPRKPGQTTIIPRRAAGGQPRLLGVPV